MLMTYPECCGVAMFGIIARNRFSTPKEAIDNLQHVGCSKEMYFKSHEQRRD